MRGETNTQMKNRHRRYELSISEKGKKYPSLMSGEKYFIECSYCNKRIEGKDIDIDQYYKNHLENWHNEKPKDVKSILGNR
jgi:hypothetical protein